MPLNRRLPRLRLRRFRLVRPGRVQWHRRCTRSFVRPSLASVSRARWMRFTRSRSAFRRGRRRALVFTSSRPRIVPGSTSTPGTSRRRCTYGASAQGIAILATRPRASVVTSPRSRSIANPRPAGALIPGMGPSVRTACHGGSTLLPASPATLLTRATRRARLPVRACRLGARRSSACPSPSRRCGGARRHRISCPEAHATASIGTLVAEAFGASPHSSRPRRGLGRALA